MENNNNEITDEYDREFINLIMEIEKKIFIIKQI